MPVYFYTVVPVGTLCAFMPKQAFNIQPECLYQAPTVYIAVDPYIMIRYCWICACTTETGPSIWRYVNIRLKYCASVSLLGLISGPVGIYQG